MSNESRIKNRKTYLINGGKYKGEKYWVEGLWKEVTGKSWMDSDGNPAALEYAIRSGMEGDTRFDNNVYYGKIGGLGKLIHETQIGEEVEPDDHQ